MREWGTGSYQLRECRRNCSARGFMIEESARSVLISNVSFFLFFLAMMIGAIATATDSYVPPFQIRLFSFFSFFSVWWSCQLQIMGRKYASKLPLTTMGWALLG